MVHICTSAEEEHQKAQRLVLSTEQLFLLFFDNDP